MSQISSNELTLLDQVDERDRAILAMLLEQIHPDDIAATVGISAAALRLRRAHIAARLSHQTKRRASPTRVGRDPRSRRRVGVHR